VKSVSIVIVLTPVPLSNDAVIESSLNVYVDKYGKSSVAST